jgi:hypothetical protein
MVPPDLSAGAFAAYREELGDVDVKQVLEAYPRLWNVGEIQKCKLEKGRNLVLVKLFGTAEEDMLAAHYLPATRDKHGWTFSSNQKVDQSLWPWKDWDTDVFVFEFRLESDGTLPADVQTQIAEQCERLGLPTAQHHCSPANSLSQPCSPAQTQKNQKRLIDFLDCPSSHTIKKK